MVTVPTKQKEIPKLVIIHDVQVVYHVAQVRGQIVLVNWHFKMK